MAVAVVIMSGCLISPIIPIGGGGKSRTELQHESLGKLFPAQLVALGKWTSEVRVARLRVWADDEYRAQNLRWQRGFDEELDYANHVLFPMLGVRLEAEYRSWERHAPGSTLADHLETLATIDPGDDVVWVVGLTSSLSLASATFEQLGVATLGGRHLVVRGHADLEERKAFERAFPDLDPEERESVLEARRRHKTTAVLIHELAHSLGALHETEPDWIMNASYSHHAASISDRNRELMLITLDERLKPPAARDPRATTQKLLAALDVEWGGWEADERAELVENLRAELGAKPARGITGSAPAAVMGQYRHAEQRLATGDHRGSQAELESADPQPAIEIAAARLAAGDPTGARATLVTAEARIESLAPGETAAAWLMLAAQYRAMGAITWTEDALAKAGATATAYHKLAAWAATTRVRYGIPRDGVRWKLVPEDDAAALRAVHGVLDLVNANRFDAAAKAATAAEKRWPQLPGLLAARCDLELRRGALAAARQQCDRAIAQGGSSWALYLRGILDLQSESQTAPKAGVARLREAIALDPDLGQPWRALGKALSRAKATAELEQLRHDYLARFDSPLPR